MLIFGEGYCISFEAGSIAMTVANLSRSLTPDVSGSRSNPIAWVQQLTRSKPESVAPSPEVVWAEQVQAFGNALSTLRQELGLSIAHIYLRSYVPQYHLVSIEAGLVDKLPSPIFVRGFMKRIAEALEADGLPLKALIPAALPEATVVSTGWIDTIETPTLQPSHLYIGYGALLVGAIGGISMGNVNQASMAMPDSQADNPSPSGDQRLGDRASQQRSTEQAMRLMYSQPIGQRQIPDSFRPES
jgi:cytoskeleton protein RodZ